jgi:hypothetical protein
MKYLSIIVITLILLITPQAWGFTSQTPSLYRQTMWNNLTDSMHTLGQPPQKAKITKMKLHAARTKARLRSLNKTRQKTWFNQKPSGNHSWLKPGK